MPNEILLNSTGSASPVLKGISVQANLAGPAISVED
jgi:hypothetical protein